MIEKELNIADILRDKPKYTKLYSPICGELKTDEIIPNGIFCKTDRSKEIAFMDDGTKKSYGYWSNNGECLLFPSKQMRDWDKFTWKRGDVLKKTGDNILIFEEWTNDEYTTFSAVFIRFFENNVMYKEAFQNPTSFYDKVSNEEAKEYIKEVEEHYGGKLNLSTLEIENVQEPNEGDVVYLPKIENETYPVIFIFKEIADGNIYDHVSLVFENRYSPRLCVDCQNIAWESDKKYMRPATEEQKQQLFDALAKAGKRWNPDAKQIEDLPKQHQFKPFELVLVRDEENEGWKAQFFSHRMGSDEDYPYMCIGYPYRFCIPYEGNEHLLGTTDNPKGGDQ